jgi:hypothetical protein
LLSGRIIEDLRRVAGDLHFVDAKHQRQFQPLQHRQRSQWPANFLSSL